MALQVAQERTALGRLLSAPVVALLLGLGGAAAGLLPAASATYDAVWQFLMPLAAALILLEADLRGQAPEHSASSNRSVACSSAHA